MKKFIKKTLPIEFKNHLILDLKKAITYGDRLQKKYKDAKPYPNIVIDNFLPSNLANHILQIFPPPKKTDQYRKNEFGGYLKRQSDPNDGNRPIKELFNFFNSPPFLSFLENLTGIDGLIPDPYFFGGGFHEISNSGKLGIHADFRIHEKLKLQRRINVLIYLNKRWRTRYGGNLEIWDKKMKNLCISVQPIFNRCVIFNTDSNSFHGHPEPLKTPKNVTRKSIALYYYTASDNIFDEVPNFSTHYRSQPGSDFKTKFGFFKWRYANYKRDFVPPILLRQYNKLIKKIFKF